MTATANLSTLCAFLFDTTDTATGLTPIRRELIATHTYTMSESDCPYDDCTGTLYEHQYYYVCGTCSSIVGQETAHDRRSARTTDSTWEHFRDNRPRYRTSNRRRCIGGFNHEWVSSNDVEGAVRDVPPEQFYD